jgi:FlaG/FlaF family flagellin (archaellin)
MEFLKSKKGVEPLIAAVLLIVVVVGIGAVVTGIVRNYVTENKQTIMEKASDMKCGVEVAVNIPTVGDTLRICKGSGSNPDLNFTMENTGSAVIDDLQVKFFGSNGFVANDTAGTQTTAFGSDGMAAGETIAFSVKYTNTTAGQLEQVKIVPRVKVVGRSDKAFCTDAALTFTDIPNC